MNKTTLLCCILCVVNCATVGHLIAVFKSCNHGVDQEFRKAQFEAAFKKLSPNKKR